MGEPEQVGRGDRSLPQAGLVAPVPAQRGRQGPRAQSKEWGKKWALESLPKLDPRRGAWVFHFETHGAVVGIKKNVNLTEDTPVTVFLLSESLRD